MEITETHLSETCKTTKYEETTISKPGNQTKAAAKPRHSLRICYLTKEIACFFLEVNTFLLESLEVSWIQNVQDMVSNTHTKKKVWSTIKRKAVGKSRPRHGLDLSPSVLELSERVFNNSHDKMLNHLVENISYICEEMEGF